MTHRTRSWPYNSYAVHQKGIPSNDSVCSRTLNPDLLRYELHRVWVVDATLRKGFKHPEEKRRFYIDEDRWTSLRQRCGAAATSL